MRHSSRRQSAVRPSGFAVVAASGAHVAGRCAAGSGEIGPYVMGPAWRSEGDEAVLGPDGPQNLGFGLSDISLAAATPGRGEVCGVARRGAQDRTVDDVGAAEGV